MVCDPAAPSCFHSVLVCCCLPVVCMCCSIVVTVRIQTQGIPPLHVQRGEAAYNEIKVILRKLGVSDADVRDTSVNIGKACSYRCSELKKREYSYRANLDVLLPTIDAAVAFLGQLKARPAGEVSVGNIRFPLIDAEALVRTAQQLSIDALEAQASAMTSAMGGRLGDIVALRSRDNKDSLLRADRNSYRNNFDRTLDVYTTGRIEMFHNFS